MNDMSPNNVIKVILVEDDLSFREELAARLDRSPQLDVVAVYGSAADAIAGIEHHDADVVLLDLGLPDMSGLEVIRQTVVRADAPEFLVLTVFDDDRHLFPALQAGAVGYIVKDRTVGTNVTDAIREVVQGGAPMSLGIARRVLDNFCEKRRRHSRCKQLSTREREVLEYLAHGYNARNVAEMLGISYQTVRSHQKNIYKKLHVNSLIKAVEILRSSK